MQLFSASCFPTIFFPAGSKVDQRGDFWGEITRKFKTVEQGSENKRRVGTALGMMSGQQAVANVLGLEVNVKNGDHGIFVFQLLQAAEEEAFRVYNRATPSSNQSSSRHKQDWRWRSCLFMGCPCSWGAQAWEMTEGLLGGKQSLQHKGEGSPSTSHPKKQPRRTWRNLSQPAPDLWGFMYGTVNISHSTEQRLGLHLRQNERLLQMPCSSFCAMNRSQEKELSARPEYQSPGY